MVMMRYERSDNVITNIRIPLDVKVSDQFWTHTVGHNHDTTAWKQTRHWQSVLSNQPP